MLGALQEQPKDKILGLMELYRDDPRETKLDLGVGVYKDASGGTPIFSAIKKAEARLLELETTKSYTGLVGDQGYRDAMAKLILGGSVPSERLASCHTPGGTGAVHQVMELQQLAGKDATLWVSDPTWPNHLSIIKHLGLPSKAYPYFDNQTRGVNFDGMMETLKTIPAGDVVLLHGCCHNPTGANLNPTQWKEVSDVLVERGIIPFVDIAYQGFGDGLEQDAFGIRLLAETCPEVMIAASCSKNFGIYRERAGLTMVVSPDAKTSSVVQGNLSHLNRQNFSFPPDHGARLVTMVLDDPALRTEWETELEGMRLGMLKAREGLAAALQAKSGSDRFGFIAEHRGMFSRIGATPEQVLKLREEHAVYMVGDSRVNIAGVTENVIDQLADAIVAVGV